MTVSCFEAGRDTDPGFSARARPESLLASRAGLVALGAGGRPRERFPRGPFFAFLASWQASGWSGLKSEQIGGRFRSRAFGKCKFQLSGTNSKDLARGVPSRAKSEPLLQVKRGGHLGCYRDVRTRALPGVYKLQCNQVQL